MLPVVSMSRATATCSGSLSALIIESMIRMLAWCGMKASSWSAVMPAASSACWATFAISNTAQRKTAWPSWVMAGKRTSVAAPCSRYTSHDRVWVMVSDLSPSEPHTIGPIAGSSDGPTTTAPAPSPNRKAVARSCLSVRSLSRSTPMTRT